jgi:hypothetical protein
MLNKKLLCDQKEDLTVSFEIRRDTVSLLNKGKNNSSETKENITHQDFYI